MWMMPHQACPNRATALEKVIHDFAENPKDNVIVPKIGYKL